ncbi:hypothetical protein IV203_009945 [Nitzschia inconspicua]|uniref:WH2 domain-containing protein n=1 Tax=Nitzschia inconspicua TaxID=303405 RepID=A0A9K3KV60_9STRA|nr:hypothetical protein IV203_009945 [Nitzschia inconspicua]
MAFLFRKKKPNLDAAAQQKVGDDALQGQVDELQGEVNFLKKRLLSIQAKVPATTPHNSNASRQEQLPSMIEETASRGIVPASRSPFVAKSEGSRTISPTKRNGPKQVVSRPSVADIVIGHGAEIVEQIQDDEMWHSEASFRSNSMKAGSFASSKGDGEVFYKDGKKYRRVVRMVRSTGPADAALYSNKPSSTRSVSSSHGIEEVTEGHVQAMRAKYSMTSIASDVSTGSKSCADRKIGRANQGLRVRAVGDPNHIATPKHGEKKSVNQKQWDDRPSPLPLNGMPSNPWLRKDMNRTKSIDKARSIPEPPFLTQVESPWMKRDVLDNSRPLQHASSPFTNTKNLDVGTKLTYSKSSEDPSSLTTEKDRNGNQPAKQFYDDEKVTAKPYRRSVQAALEPESQQSNRAQAQREPASGSQIQSKATGKGYFDRSSQLDRIRQKGGQQEATKTANSSSKQEAAITSKSPNPMIKIDRGMKSDEASAGGSSTGTPRKYGGSNSTQLGTRPNSFPKAVREQDIKVAKNRTVAVQAPLAKMHESTQMRTQPKDFLKEIRKQDVKLKKPPTVAVQSPPAKMHGGSNGVPNDLLAGIRAGVPLKKIEKSTIQTPKQHSSSFLNEMLATFQQRKSECLSEQAKSGEFDF